jgi:Tfp pilus assembly protein PilN
VRGEGGVRAPLNLASRPFRNERLPALGFGLAALLLLALTARHALVVRQVLPGRSAALEQEVKALDRQIETLRSEAATLRGPRPDSAQVTQWALLRSLVDQRAFSWTDFLAVLEEVLPAGVRLVSIAPSVKEGQLHVDLGAVARKGEDGFDFMRALQERKEFQDVNLLGVGEGAEGADLTFSMRYVAPANAGRAEKRP